MKKWLSILLATSLLLCSCGSKEPAPENEDGNKPDVSVTESTTLNGEGSGEEVSDTTTEVVTETVTQTVTDASGKPVTEADGKPVTTVITTIVTILTEKPTDGKTTTKAGNDGTTGTTKKPGTTTTTKKQGGASTTKKTTTSTTKKVTTTTTSKITVTLGASDLALFQNIVNTENAWLASTQLSNGALPMTPTTSGTATVNPYFADFAALSMLNQADKYASNVKKYMEWHFDHLNTAKTDYNDVDGTIYDYTATVSNGKVTGESHSNSYDSTDSYAATFLMVVQKYVEKTGDKAYAVSRAKDIERVVNALFATVDKDGLTWAKPDYKIKYLMDNCEVYEGMVAGAKLYSDVLVPAGAGSKTTRDKLKNGADTVAEKIESEMWRDGYYQPAGTKRAPSWKFNWSEYYPCATSQVFPIIFGLLDPSTDRAKNLYSNFCNSVAWEYFDYEDKFYWGSNVQAAVKMGDVDRVRTYMTKYQKIPMKTHGYPLYNADAAKVCMAAYEIIQMAD